MIIKALHPKMTILARQNAFHSVAIFFSGFLLTVTLLQAEGKKKNPFVEMQTNMGNLTIELLPEEAPVTVANFLAYVDSGFYNGTIFHRVVPGFVIQGGGFDSTLNQKSTRDPIVNEADNGLLNKRGSLSMARRPDKNSATSQFFINLVDNAMLDHGTRDFGYAVYARVTKGMEVVDAIAKLETSNRDMYQNVPMKTVTIQKALRKK